MHIAENTWSVGLHQSVRILGDASPWLAPVLRADGRDEAAVLASLPYDVARSRGTGTGAPDRRRYRDAREVVQSMGLAYEDSSRSVRVTELGRATLRWLPDIRPSNAVALGRYAAYALAACRLRNPMRKRVDYDESVTARPFAYLWRAMLALDGIISSEEINGSLLYALDELGLAEAIERIRRHRQDPDTGALFPDVETGQSKNDRIIPIVAAGSFGFTFIQDKRETGGKFYRLRPETYRIIESAANAEFPIQDHATVPAYVEHISNMASLPKDLR